MLRLPEVLAGFRDAFRRLAVAASARRLDPRRHALRSLACGDVK
jgi:hypothetical protein